MKANAIVDHITINLEFKNKLNRKKKKQFDYESFYDSNDYSENNFKIFYDILLIN